MAIKRAASRGFFLTTEKAARGEADGLEREGCGEGDGLLTAVGRGGRLWVLAMQAMRGRAGTLAGMRRAVPSAVAEAPPSLSSAYGITIIPGSVLESSSSVNLMLVTLNIPLTVTVLLLPVHTSLVQPV